MSRLFVRESDNKDQWFVCTGNNMDYAILKVFYCYDKAVIYKNKAEGERKYEND